MNKFGLFIASSAAQFIFQILVMAHWNSLELPVLGSTVETSLKNAFLSEIK